MAMWPFRRKSQRKHSGSGPGPGPATADAPQHSSRSHTDSSVARAASKKKQRSEPAKLQRRTRTYSFSPGRDDALGVDRNGRPAHRRPPSRSRNQDDPIWERTPTLYLKRDDQRPARRKSSKRRRDDHEREAEIKAMSAHMPSRGDNDIWPPDMTGKPTTKRSKTSRSSKPAKRLSDTSLPLPTSMHSNNSSDPDFSSFKVSALDSLAPRPTLRYSPSTRRTTALNSVAGQPTSPKRPFGDRNVIPEEPGDSRRRIDNLADDLDARELRELMDRDRRRRERHLRHEQARVEQKIASTAERQRRESEEARKSGSPSAENLERGVMGRELAGLGLDPNSVVVTSSRQRHSASPQPGDGLEDAAGQPKAPLDSFHRTDTMPLDEPETEPVKAPGHKQSVEPEEQVSALPQGSKLAGILKSKKSRSKSTLGSDRDRQMTTDEDDARKGSDSSTTKANRLSFTSLLRWGNKSRRNSGPSSFSNTSREEMQAIAQAQADALAKLQGEIHPALRSTEHVPQVSSSVPATSAAATPSTYKSSKPRPGFPKRTQSRFREDLPDFPLSPPDSRLHSPEPVPPVPTAVSSEQDGRALPIPIPPSSIPPSSRDAAGSSRHASSNERLYGAPSPDAHLSMSLASIDSEGSWLSGGAGHRRSANMRDSVIRANRHKRAFSSSPTNSTQEDLGIMDDDYLTRLTPAQDTFASLVPRPSGDYLPSSDDEDNVTEGNAKWGAVGARPQFVHRHDRDTMHSRYGLLNADSGDEGNNTSYIEDARIERASSVDVGRGHARNFSAGSAKKFHVTPRTSTDNRL